MNDFMSLGLPQPILKALEKMNFTAPTPIQAQSIPPALSGRDVLGSAQTGTGKTAAFAIPLITRLLTNPQGTALVMTPTRELAAQVVTMIDQLLTASPGIRTALLIGGQSMFKQLQQLRQRPRIIVGTPGRINDHLQQNSLNLSQASFLVLDETDRMLDMGFGPQIDRIVKKLPPVRQTLMFSATLPAHIVKISQQYLKDPVRVAVGEVNQPIRAIKQELIRVNVADKYNTLMTQLRQREGSVIVFVRTKRGADRLAKKLNGEKQSADSIHGNLNQNQRNRVIQAFRDKKHRIMVATDVAARGLDIPHIEHVINYDLPQVAEDYIHRIGRTARNGCEGAAVCFITPEDGELWGAIDALLNPGAPRTRPVSHSGKPVGRPYAQKHNRNGFRDRKARDERGGGGGRNGQNGQRSHGRSDDRSNDRGEDRKSGRSGDRFGGRFENRSEIRSENRSGNGDRSGRPEYGQRRTARAFFKHLNKKPRPAKAGFFNAVKSFSAKQPPPNGETEQRPPAGVWLSTRSLLPAERPPT